MKQHNVDTLFKTPPKYQEKRVIQNKDQIGEIINEEKLQSLRQTDEENKQENLRLPHIKPQQQQIDKEALLSMQKRPNKRNSEFLEEEQKVDNNKFEQNEQIDQKLMMIGFEAMVQSDLLTQQIQDLEQYDHSLEQLSQQSLKLIHKSDINESQVSRKKSNSFHKRIFIDGKLIIKSNNHLIFQKWSQINININNNPQTIKDISITNQSQTNYNDQIDEIILKYLYYFLLEKYQQQQNEEGINDFNVSSFINVYYKYSSIVRIEKHIIEQNNKNDQFEVGKIHFSVSESENLSDDENKNCLRLNKIIDEFIRFGYTLYTSSCRQLKVHQIVHQFNDLELFSDLLAINSQSQDINNSIKQNYSEGLQIKDKLNIQSFQHLFQPNPKHNNKLENQNIIKFNNQNLQNKSEQNKNKNNELQINEETKKQSKGSSNKMSIDLEKLKSYSNQSSFGIKQKQFSNNYNSSQNLQDILSEQEESHNQQLINSDDNSNINIEKIKRFQMTKKNYQNDQKDQSPKKIISQRNSHQINNQFADIVIHSNRNISVPRSCNSQYIENNENKISDRNNKSNQYFMNSNIGSSINRQEIQVQKKQSDQQSQQYDKIFDNSVSQQLCDSYNSSKPQEIMNFNNQIEQEGPQLQNRIQELQIPAMNNKSQFYFLKQQLSMKSSIGSSNQRAHMLQHLEEVKQEGSPANNKKQNSQIDGSLVVSSNPMKKSSFQSNKMLYSGDQMISIDSSMNFNKNTNKLSSSNFLSQPANKTIQSNQQIANKSNFSINMDVFSSQNTLQNSVNISYKNMHSKRVDLKSDRNKKKSNKSLFNKQQTKNELIDQNIQNYPMIKKQILEKENKNKQEWKNISNASNIKRSNSDFNEIDIRKQPNADVENLQLQRTQSLFVIGFQQRQKKELFNRLTSESAIKQKQSNFIEISKVEEMKENMEGQQKFMNMVVHDMRNPAEAINNGLKQAREMAQSQTQTIISQTQKLLQSNLNNSSIQIRSNSNINRFSNQIKQQRLASNHSENLKQNKLEVSNKQENQIKILNKNFINLFDKKNKILEEVKIDNKIIQTNLNQMKIEKINENEQLKGITNKSLNFIKKLSSSIKKSVSGNDSSMQILLSENDESIVGKESLGNSQYDDENILLNRELDLIIEQRNKNRQINYPIQEHADEHQSNHSNQDVHLRNQDAQIISNSVSPINRMPPQLQNIQNNNQLQIIEQVQNIDNELEMKQILEKVLYQLNIDVAQIQDRVNNDQINNNNGEEQKQAEENLYDFNSDDMDEDCNAPELNNNQAPLENDQIVQNNPNHQIQNNPLSSLIINQPRQIQARENSQFLKKNVPQPINNHNQAVPIEKFTPLLRQEQILKVDREIQTQNSFQNFNNQLESVYIQQLINNQDFKTYLNNFRNFSQIIQLLRRFNNQQSIQDNIMEQIIVNLKKNLLNNQNQQQQYNRNIRIQQDQQQIIAINETPSNQKKNVLDQQNQPLSPKKLNKVKIKSLNFEENQQQMIIHKSSNQIRSGQQSLQNELTDEQDENEQSIFGCGGCPKYKNIIKGLLQQNLKMYKLNKTMDYYALNSISSSQIILNLIEDLLTLAKIQKRVFEINMDSNVNLIDIVTEAFKVVAFNAEMKKLQLLLQIDISQPFILQRVQIDKRRILQILLNFLSNSIKFTNQGGFIKIVFDILEEQVQDDNKLNNSKQDIKILENKSIENKINSEKQKKSNISKNSLNKQQSLLSQDSSKNESNDQQKDVSKFIKLKIIIEDNGAGIMKENINKLFTDFEKLNEHKAMNAKGTGLGLSICKQIIEQMGGKVAIKSEVGVGTQFEIILQLKVVDSITKVNNQEILINKRQKSQNNILLTENFLQNYKLSEDQNKSINLICDESEDFSSDKDLSCIGKIERMSKMKQNEIYEFIQINNQPLITSDENDQHCNYITSIISQLQNKQFCSPNTILSQSSKNQLDYNFNTIMSKTNQLQIFKSQNEEQYYPEQIQQQKIMKYISNNIQQSGDLIGIQVENQNKNKVNPNRMNSFSFQNFQLSKQSLIPKSSDKLSSIISSQIQSSNVFAKIISEQFQLENIEEIKENESPQYQFQTFEQNSENLNDQQWQLVPGMKQSINLSNKKQILQKKYLKDAVGILKKYNKRKLNILLANDDSYSLLVVDTTMQQLNYVSRVDTAQNGQIALDLVKSNEKSEEATQHKNYSQNHHFYDAIFLDLEMPILNGNEACRLIQNHYKMINSTSQIDLLFDYKPKNQTKLLNTKNQSNVELNQLEIENLLIEQKQESPQWIIDLKLIYDRFQEMCAINQNDQKRENDKNEFEVMQNKMLKIFNVLYANQRYEALVYMKRPFMFAYSAMVNNKVIEKAQQSGFEECIDAPLNKIKIENVISDYINMYAYHLTRKMLSQLGPVPNLAEMIDDIRVKQCQIQSSSDLDKSLSSLINSRNSFNRDLKSQQRDSNSIPEDNQYNELYYPNLHQQDQQINFQNDQFINIHPQSNGLYNNNIKSIQWQQQMIKKEEKQKQEDVVYCNLDELSNIVEAQERDEQQSNSQYSIFFLSNGNIHQNNQKQRDNKNDSDLEIEDEIDFNNQIKYQDYKSESQIIKNQQIIQRQLYSLNNLANQKNSGEKIVENQFNQIEKISNIKKNQQFQRSSFEYDQIFSSKNNNHQNGQNMNQLYSYPSSQAFHLEENQKQEEDPAYYIQSSQNNPISSNHIYNQYHPQPYIPVQNMMSNKGQQIIFQNNDQAKRIKKRNSKSENSNQKNNYQEGQKK